jgi:hypothetical protein
MQYLWQGTAGRLQHQPRPQQDQKGLETECSESKKRERKRHDKAHNRVHPLHQVRLCGKAGTGKNCRASRSIVY